MSKVGFVKSIFIFILFSILLYTLLNTSQSKENLKQNLINQANDNNIKAMLELNKKHFFIETKQGLAFYKKWYFDVLKSDDLEAVLLFAKIFKEHEDLFVNGQLKYLKLLETAKEKGSKQASFDLLKYYENNMLGDKELKKKYENLKEEILKDQSKQNLLQLKEVLQSIRKWDDVEKLRALMEKKGFLNSSLQNKKEFDLAYRKSKYVGYDKNRLPNIVNKIILSNSIDDILYASNKIKYSDHELKEKLLYKALELSETNSLKGKIYFDLALNQENLRKHLFKLKRYYQGELRKYGNFNKVKDIKNKIAKLDERRKNINDEFLAKFYEKAGSFDNLKALKKLYAIYSKDYSKDYHRIVKKLKQSDKGLMFYLQKNPYDTNIELFEKLALKGNKDIIVRLAKQNLNNKLTKLEDIAKKYRQIVLESKDSSLHIKMKNTLNSYSYKYSEKAKAFLKKLEEKEKTWENIYVLRNKLEKLDSRRKYKQYKQNLELLASYGDIKSTLKLASINSFKGFDWKYEDNKEQARKNVLKALEIYEELAKQDSKIALEKLSEIYSSKTFMNKEVYALSKALKYYERLISLEEYRFFKKIIKIYKCKDCGFYDEKKLIDVLKLAFNLTKDKYYAKKLAMFYYKKSKFQDLKEAKNYFELSNENYYLARLYYDKDALGVDLKKSYSYLKNCASLEVVNNKCNYLMGIFYKNGFAVKKDEKKAASYFRFASYDNYSNPPKAALELTKLYEKHKMYKETVNVYMRVAKYYRIQALENLNRLYKKSLVSRDDLKALHRYFKQRFALRWSKNEQKNAALCLAYMYKNGVGIKKNIDEAKKWQEKANKI